MVVLHVVEVSRCFGKTSYGAVEVIVNYPVLNETLFRMVLLLVEHSAHDLRGCNPNAEVFEEVVKVITERFGDCVVQHQ